jgi:hypothetical protein
MKREDAWVKKDTMQVAIDDEIAYMKRQLKYYDDWCRENKEGARPANEFLDMRTYKNIRTGVVGFLLYAKSVLSLEDGPKRVSYLDSNSSGIENLFSQIRGANRDTPDTFGKGMAGASLGDQERKLRGERKRALNVYSTSYGGEHQADDHGGMTLASSKHVVERETEFSFGPAAGFFHKVFGRLTTDEEAAFDYLCQQLNRRLAACFGKCMERYESSKGKKQIHFNQTLLEFLQSKQFTDLALSSTVPEFNCRPGLCVVAQSLWSSLLNLVRSSLPVKKVETLQTATRSVNFKVEVNSFFGWAISEVHKSLLAELTSAEFDLSKSDDSELLQARLDFVSAMRYFDHEAVLNESYLQDCYDGIFQFMNCGGLTLVAPEYFGFGKTLMQVIVDGLNSDDFEEIGSSAVKEGWEHVEKNMSRLKEAFLECSKMFTGITVSDKLKILQMLVTKTRNARFGVEVRTRRNEKTKRGGKNHVGTSLREGMKATKEGSKVNTKLTLAAIRDDEYVFS